MLQRGISRRNQAARILGANPAWDEEEAHHWQEQPASQSASQAAESGNRQNDHLEGKGHAGELASHPLGGEYADEAEDHSDDALADDQTDALPGDDDERADHSAGMLDEPEWDDELDDDDYEPGRALVPAGQARRLAPRTPLQGILTRLRGEPTDPALWRGPTPTAPVMIPGKRRVARPGALGHTPLVPFSKRHRPFLMHFGIVLMAFIMLGGVAFAAAPLNTQLQILSDIAGFAGSGAPPSNSQAAFHWYVVHYGDSLKSIADKFAVLPGGILEMNSLQDADQIYVGLRLKIPTDPTYGASYQAQIDIPIPPPDKVGNVYGTNPWNSLSGPTDPNNVCAPAGNADTQANRQLFQLIEPDPNAGFARGWTWYHNGVDLSNPVGVPILAAQAGLVVFAGWDNLGLGYSVKLNHCNGLSTMYGHMRDFPLVHAGDYVQVGQQLGVEGSTGNSTGPHLHFMTEWFNKPSNPYCFDFNLPSGDTPCQSS